MQLRILFLAACLALSSTAAAPVQPTLTGRVVAVTDGDTLTLLTPDKIQHKVRLDQIDAPESGQPWGRNAKRLLSDRVFDKTVTVRSSGRDRYGRTLGRVSADGADVNAALVREGGAWAYRQYLTDRRMIALEQDARAAGRGLWALPAAETTPPWAWRAAQRSSPRAPPRNGGSSSFRCGEKRYCTQMTSCEEARFHLKQCGLSRLDADNDGVPCESLCRAGA